MLQMDAERAAERQARLLQALAEQREVARVNPQRPQRKLGLLRRLLRPGTEPAPLRLD
jgi:hypothetical protein